MPIRILKDKRTDKQLNDAILIERRFARVLPSLDLVEELERAADTAKDELARRYSSGKAGREGLPDQG